MDAKTALATTAPVKPTENVLIDGMNGGNSETTTAKAVVKKDPYDLMVELAAAWGEENHDVKKTN